MPGITHFYFDGEELTVKTAQKLRERFPNARIINAYGPTEATVALSAVAVTDEMLTLSNAYQSAIPRLILQPLSLTRKAINCQMANREKSLFLDQPFQKVI